MDVNEFAERIYLNLPYSPTHQQVQLIAALAHFCADGSSESVFLLNGYAGTGKTSLCGALVRALGEVNIPVVLMAPTGRAAKVFGAYAGHFCSTIHRRIYRSREGEMMAFSGEVADNTFRHAVFIVDEASMIGNDVEVAERGALLDDLIHYVYTGEGCRLILVGDTAQLPPVGCVVSPAMSKEVLRSYGLKVTRATLTSTVRQARESGILYNATALRRAMALNPLPAPHITEKGFDDVRVVSHEELQDSLGAAYADLGVDNVLLVTRSNRRAVQFNQAIRANILDRDEQLCHGERLMVAKNNYLWSAKVKGLDFIANGDIAIVDAIYGVEQKYGFTFADVRLTLTDRDVDVECKIVLDALTSQSPALSREQYGELYNRIITDPELFTPTTSLAVRHRLLRKDPYFNALQVKYAYAVTCHKAQGGQWSAVYVDIGFVPPEATGIDLYRWLYTAVTRATRTLYFTETNMAVQ